MSTKREILVGGFVLTGIFLTALVIMMIGNERRAFDSKVEFKASFKDVQGLKPGAPVRLSGIDIGTVTDVGHGKDPNDDKLYVKVEVVRAEAGRVREDSAARIANKGLLGDKMLEITPGTPGKQALSAGSTVASDESGDLGNLMAKAGDMMAKADAIMTNVEKMTGSLAEDQTRKDMQQSLHAVTVILNQVSAGDGYVGKLLHDPEEAARISHALQNLEQTTRKANDTMDNVQVLLARVNKGPGFAHDLVYSEQGSQTLASFGTLANETSTTLKGIREGNGLARGVIYGDSEQQKIMGNLSAMSTDMREIMAGVKQGKGTIGGLLVDPSVYEDMKAILGNVERNDVLRALVRYSIKKDEQKPTLDVKGESKPVTPSK
jgi:phospholipid/cholesterol/gamma-HCH transport system substrate-binding protein